MDYLSEIVNIKDEDSTKIKLIASLDKIQSTQLFDEKLIEDMNCVYFRIDTYEEYAKEKEFDTPLFNFTSDIQAIGISYIMNSMTEVQRKVIQLIASYKLTNPKEQGISFEGLYEIV